VQAVCALGLRVHKRIHLDRLGDPIVQALGQAHLAVVETLSVSGLRTFDVINA
jgi:hypothetical protein